MPRDQDRFIAEIKLYLTPEVKITDEYCKMNIKKQIRQLIEEVKDMDKKRLKQEV